jgi:transposase InsO family protein
MGSVGDLVASVTGHAPAVELLGHHRRASPGVEVYTSADYGAFARANGVVLSVGMAGQCWDNAAAESSFATIKRELIDTCAWPSRAGPRAAIFDYIEGRYNTCRLPSSLGNHSPTEYEATIHDHAVRQAA